MKKLLAIGCGGAGMFSLIVASQLRKGKFETIVLSDEPDIYCRCTSTYILSGEAELDDAIQPESMVAEYGVKIVHEKAVKIDTTKREVTTEQGSVFPYDELVIATGARPMKPSIPGIEAETIHTVRTSDDVRRIEASARDAKSAVVIGAGVIGIEMAGALLTSGVQKVFLIEHALSVSPMTAGQEFAPRLIAHLEEHKIDTRFGVEVKAIVMTSQGQKQVTIEKDGVAEEILVDMVVVAAGIYSNSELAQAAGIKTVRQGICVDSRMRTSARHVYACGDCVVVPGAVTGELAQSALASLAIQQSKIVGFQLAGFPIRYQGSVGAAAFRVLGKEHAIAGITEEVARKKFHFVVIGRAETTDIYNDLKAKQPLSVKLIFAGWRMRLVGYEAFGNGVIPSAEVASLAIGARMNILKLLHFNSTAHPSLTPWPFMNPIIMATEDATNTLMTRIKAFFG